MTIELKKEEEFDIFANKEDDEPKSKHPAFERILEDTYFQTFITILTVYALFGDDIRVMATNSNADIGFDLQFFSKFI